MAKLNIKTRLIIAFSLIILLFCIALAVALSATRNINQQFNQYFAVNQIRLNAAQDMYGYGLLSGVALRNLLINPKLKKPYTVVPKAIQKFDEYFTNVHKLAKGNPELLKNLDSINKYWTLAKASKLRTLALLKAGKPEQAQTELRTKEHPNWYQVRIGLQNIVEEENSLIAALQEEINATTNRAYVLTTVLALVAIITAIIISIVIVLTITRAFSHVTHSLNDIASGDGDLTKRLEESGGDEVSQLAAAFNRFIVRIHELVSHVTTSTSNLMGSANEMSSISTETLQGVTRQQTETELAATAMNQMTATVQEVARSASDASQAAQEADKEAIHGSRVVGEVVTAIRDLAGEVESSAKTINNLNQDSENIGSVLVVIRGIAEQTNLLALNAAIEAARAGEQGRGFAVVADEVRTLASRTQEATQEIQEMIERLQAGAGSAVTAMGQGQNKAGISVERAEKAGEVLNAITSAVTRIADMNTQIATAAEQQSSVAEEINKNVVNINEISNQTADGAQQTSTASENLRHLATELQGLVESFKV